MNTAKIEQIFQKTTTPQMTDLAKKNTPRMSDLAKKTPADTPQKTVICLECQILPQMSDLAKYTSDLPFKASEKKYLTGLFFSKKQRFWGGVKKKFT